MTLTIGRPKPDCTDREEVSRKRRESLLARAEHQGPGLTHPNGEETNYGQTYPLNFHKSLPHDVDGNVHRASYEAMVAALTDHAEGALETLPAGANRGSGANGAPNGSELDPPRYTTTDKEQDSGKPLRYRGLTSPLTGHVFDTQGGDAGAFAIAPAPLVASDELAAEMAEVYVMALCRDATFSDIASGSAPANIATLVGALDSMPWFDGSFTPTNPAEAARFDTRGVINGPDDLFRGSTPGSKVGPWASQYLVIGNTNTSATFEKPNGTAAAGNNAQPSFRGVKSNISIEDGFILYGTQIIDQRSIVAREGRDYMTNWAAWIDCQNGVDFNGFDRFRDKRRYLTTPRDIATYVHYDALYQAYLNACLIMLADGKNFPKSRGLPESKSRTRSAFASFGGPHILSAVTEVATRALKAVWRQKWMHHRRARPEVVAALLTLHEHDPNRIADPVCRAAIGDLRTKIPQVILDAIASHNTAQNALSGAIAQDPALDATLAASVPPIADAANFLLPMAFPEGSPTHPAYGAGHATVAGACVTTLKAYFEMTEADGTARAWPYEVFAPEQKENEGGELIPVAPQPSLTVEGELDKLAANISIARNMAGVHYYTDYYESVRLGERIAVSIIEEQLGMYGEPVSVAFTSFDGDKIRIRALGASAGLSVTASDGSTLTPAEWYGRYSA